MAPQFTTPGASGYLRLDVERRLAARGPASVAGLDELAHLGLEPGVGRGAQRAQLRVDVGGRLATRDAAGVAGLEQVAQVGLALGGRRRRRRVVERQPAAPIRS